MLSEPTSARGARRSISRDGRSALVKFDITGDAQGVEQQVDPMLAATAAAQKAHPDLRSSEFGDASAGKALYEVVRQRLQEGARRCSLPITLVILLLAFGALVAAGLPLLLGLTGRRRPRSACSAAVSHIFPSTESITVGRSCSIGLAVGVDYSLFYLRREREERAAGRSHARPRSRPPPRPPAARCWSPA